VAAIRAASALGLGLYNLGGERDARKRTEPPTPNLIWEGRRRLSTIYWSKGKSVVPSVICDCQSLELPTFYTTHAI